MFVRVSRRFDLFGSSVSSIAEESFIRMQRSSVCELHSIVVLKSPSQTCFWKKAFCKFLQSVWA